MRTLRAPSFRRFAWLGVGIAILTLTRPASQVLLVAVLLPLLVAWPWKPRLTGAAILLVAAVLPLAAWATVNWVRYDEPAVARGGTVWVPFFRIFLDDRAIDPDNGSASRRLGDAIQRDVLTLPPYRRLGVDLDTYLQGGSNFEVMRLIKLSDEVFGRGDNYHVLFDAALEAAWAKPGLVLGGTADNVWTFMRERGTRDRCDVPRRPSRPRRDRRGGERGADAEPLSRSRRSWRRSAWGWSGARRTTTHAASSTTRNPSTTTRRSHAGTGN